MSSKYYSGIIGLPMSIICYGSNLSPTDIVWLYYPKGNATFTKVIYSDDAYAPVSMNKFSVDFNFSSETNILTTTLTFNKTSFEDSLFTYQCACNVYKTCSSGYKATAEAFLQTISTTTTSKTFFDI